MLFSSIKLNFPKESFRFGFKSGLYCKFVLLWICQNNHHFSVMVNILHLWEDLMWVRAELAPIYLVNNATSLASSEGTFNKAINDSALDLYKSSGIELKNLMLSEKASDRYVQCVISGYIHKQEKIFFNYVYSATGCLVWESCLWGRE